MPQTFKDLAGKFDSLKTRSPVPLSFYFELARNCSVLKTLWYSVRFHGVVVVGRGTKVRVHRSACVSLASNSMLAIGIAHDTPVGAVLRLRPQSNLRVDGRVQIMRACNVGVENGAKLTIGADTFLNEGSSIICGSAITIGSGCAISWGVRIMDTDIHRLRRDDDASPHSPVYIGKDCWLGTNATILKGAQLGDGSVVAAGAIVTSKVPPHSLVSGVPARIMRENVTWTL
jgi:acetyltransferase-like isoleucine patch superfamily enzyme